MTTQTTDTTQAPKTGHQETPNTPEQLTVLQTLGPVLAKQWLPDGTIAAYDRAKQFTVHQAPVAGIRDLHALLQKLSDDPQRCIIRGKPKSSALAAPKVQRQLIDFDDRPSRLFMVDVDNFESLLYSDPWNHPEEVAQEIIRQLPMQFQGMSHIIQLSNSCGHPTVDLFKAHLWFWLDEPMTCEEAETYTAVKLKGIGDRVVHRTVQVNYTADPVMQDGVQDTVAERLIFVEGWMGDELDIRPLDPDELPAEVRTGGRKGRDELVDPREKTGVVGALCRAFSPEQIVDLFPQDFTAGRNERRITWHGGGGSPEGVGVSTSGTHLFNTQNTSPIGDRAANLFDFVRAHIFGHMDEGVGAGAAELDVTSLPSYQATVAWALGLPEVQEELQSDEAVEIAYVHAEKVADKKEQQLGLVETKLENLQALVASMNSLAEMETKLFPRVQAARGLTPTQRDLLAGLVKDRAKDLKIKLSLQSIRESLKPAPGTGGGLGPVFPHMRNTQPKATIENVRALCDWLGVRIVYDVITKQQAIRVPDGVWTTENKDNAAFAVLESKCDEHDLFISGQKLLGYVTAIADENQFNPVLAWIESKEWDGVDRLPALYATVTQVQDFDVTIKEKTIRKWMIQAVAAACSPTPIQTRGVLVLQGPQNIGKTRWVQSLCPGVPELVLTGVQLNVGERDSVYQAVCGWLVELAELDGIVRRQDIESLKSFLGRDVDVLRLPYARKPFPLQRRTVFYGSVNGGAFLRDDDNTRFWVIPTTAVDHGHGLDMQQVWAQVHALWQGGETHWLDSEAMQQVRTSSNRFKQDDPLEDLVHRLFDFDGFDPAAPAQWVSAQGIAKRGGYDLTRRDIKSVTTKIGNIVGALNGNQRRERGEGEYAKQRVLAVPEWRATARVGADGHLGE